ncbi:hypothetical protein FHS78_003840 [Parvibaculum indicum]|jgi:hypothetical protein|uniref:hypothetical protein n=1 Tax=Parvibaculum TaxID=256616 RepID=UPI000C9533BB|nr:MULTISPECIES: hypothetical protein [Parvibaculum]MAB14731.1 hypothetical protein [Parvibaculum sp.]NIJ43525.1 hypothetical protein [Parvibaculum indicum]|tara:strand:- start:289 stop:504 length:216 start_codon:yes stop_codon:yes gene_type:complete
MDADTRDLARQISALATRLLEQGHELSVQGQSPHITPDNAMALAATLKDTASDISVLASAVEVVVGGSGSN